MWGNHLWRSYRLNLISWACPNCLSLKYQKWMQTEYWKQWIFFRWFRVGKVVASLLLLLEKCPCIGMSWATHIKKFSDLEVLAAAASPYIVFCIFKTFILQFVFCLAFSKIYKFLPRCSHNVTADRQTLFYIPAWNITLWSSKESVFIKARVGLKG